MIADSELESEALDPDYPAATGAAASNDVRSAIETVGGSRIGETAFPVVRRRARRRRRHRPPRRPGWVIVLSTPLDDVEANVALIRRQTLIAGGIALAASLLAAFIAAGYHARRIRRLEEAAERVAQGDFSVPIPVGSNDELGQLAETLDQMRRRLARARDRPPRLHRQRLARAADADRLARRLHRAARRRPEPDAETRARVRADDARADRAADEALDRPARPLPARRRRAQPAERADRPRAGSRARSAAEFAAARASGTTPASRSTVGRQEPLAQADRARTAQIMRILIDNALKHTAPGTEIAISPRSTTSEARLTVSDDGPGIDPRSPRPDLRPLLHRRLGQRLRPRPRDRPRARPRDGRRRRPRSRVAAAAPRST